MNAASSVSDPAAKNRRWKRAALVLLVFILGVLVGLLLSPRCRQCLGGDGKVSGDQLSGTGSGPPSRIAIGRGSGDGGGGGGEATGETKGRGYTGNAEGAGGSASAGGGQGTAEAAGGKLQQGQDATDNLHTAVLKQAQGLDPREGDAPSADQVTPTGKVLSAPNFTYDRTALPRYPSTRHVESALGYSRADDDKVWNSSVGIITDDPFETVVAWYRAQLPGSWQVQVLGDMDQVAQQLSPENIAAMLSEAAKVDEGGAGASGGSAGAPAKNKTAATAPADRVQVAVFDAPGGAKGRPGVLVTRHGDQPVAILLKARNS